MNCPNCSVTLVAMKRDGIDMETCPSCRGMWLTRQEMEELEDEAFDLGDDKKGSRVFDSTADTRKCPECGKPMNRSEYRFYTGCAPVLFWIDCGICFGSCRFTNVTNAWPVDRHPLRG